MRGVLLGALVLSVLLLSGCGVQPTKEQLAAADYGAFPRNYKPKIEAFMSGILKDPESAKYRYSMPCQGYWSNPAIGRWCEIHYGWIVDCEVNAKNSFGGYTGFKPYRFLLRGESIDGEAFSAGYLRYRY